MPMAFAPEHSGNFLSGKKHRLLVESGSSRFRTPKRELRSRRIPYLSACASKGLKRGPPKDIVPGCRKALNRRKYGFARVIEFC